jgi:hypothetical protein
MKYQGRIATAFFLASILFYVIAEPVAFGVSLLVAAVVAGWQE